MHSHLLEELSFFINIWKRSSVTVIDMVLPVKKRNDNHKIFEIQDMKANQHVISNQYDNYVIYMLTV